MDRPQRRQKQKAQERLGLYGSYLARGQYSQEEETDDGDYRERLSAAQQRKLRAEDEQRQKEAKEKEEQERKERQQQEEQWRQELTEARVRKKVGLLLLLQAHWPGDEGRE